METWLEPVLVGILVAGSAAYLIRKWARILSRASDRGECEGDCNCSSGSGQGSHKEKWKDQPGAK